MPRYYPLFLDLSDTLCLVVGGGAVAERKVLGLLEAGSSVRVVSPVFTPTLESLAAAGRIEAICAPYERAQLTGVSLVFAATNDRQVNAQIASDAAAQNLPVNVADAPHEGDFITPSVVRRGDLCIAITTGGNNPTLTARLAEELETRFGPEYAEFVQLLGRMRDKIKTTTTDPEARRRAFTHLLDAEVELCRLLQVGQNEAAIAQAEALIASA